MKIVEFDYRKNECGNQKKCVLLLPRPIFPLISGYSNKNYNLIAGLSKKYNLFLIVLSQRELLSEEIEYYKTTVCHTTLIVMPKIENIFGALRTVPTLVPLQVGYYYKKKIQKIVDVKIKDADIVIGALIRTIKYLDSVSNKCIKIFDMVDSIGLNYSHSAGQSTSWFWKMVYRIEGKRLIRYEIEKIGSSDCTFFVNKNEENYYSQYGKTVWIPHGVKEELFNYQQSDKTYQNCVAFIGKMDYQPNIDAVKWYAESVHSKLGKTVPFIIVGANPAPEIVNLQKRYPNIKVTGFCEDPYLYLNSAMAIVAPMQTGGGIQNKVLEGMALGKINIISTLAARPITGAEDGKHFLIADTAGEYCELIEKIIGNREQYAQIGRNAREFIKKNYTWEAYIRIYLKTLEECEE